MESAAARLKRFQDGPPVEVILTLLNSIDNFFNPEIAAAATARCWSLMIMGVHAVALTISEGLFDKRGEEGYIYFVKTFVDRDEPGSDFSTIGAELHAWRNVLAHRWLSEAGHGLAFDPDLDAGWSQQNDLTVLNPVRYHAAYQQAFDAGSPIWELTRSPSQEEQRAAKERLIRSYQR